MGYCSQSGFSLLSSICFCLGCRAHIISQCNSQYARLLEDCDVDEVIKGEPMVVVDEPVNQTVVNSS